MASWAMLYIQLGNVIYPVWGVIDAVGGCYIVSLYYIASLLMLYK